MLYGIGLPTLIIDLALAYHVIRTGRSFLWILAIGLLPPFSWIAYGAFAILPDMWSSAPARRFADNVVNVADPGRTVEQVEHIHDIAPDSEARPVHRDSPVHAIPDAALDIAPPIGFPIIAIGIPLFCYRLIGREEAGLEAEQGEPYRAFMRAVPRMWPALRAQIPASGATPDWINGLSAEVFFMSFAAGVIVTAVTLNPMWVWIGCLASPLLSWLTELAMRKSGRAVATESKE